MSSTGVKIKLVIYISQTKVTGKAHLKKQLETYDLKFQPSKK